MPPPKLQPVRPKNQKEAALWLVASEEFKWWCLLNGFKWAKHHALLGEHLQKVATGEITRLAVLLPRGSAKSTYSSILFPGFHLARNPKHCILAGSHTQELADNFGRKARNYVSAKGPCVGLDLSPDSQAASRWSTVQGGEYFGVGVGGSVVGRRGDLALLDDLLSGAEDADSKLVRDKVWDWLMFDLLPCLKPGARVILVNNRWHEDDVAGRLFDPKNEHYDAKEAAKWTVLSIPLVAETEPDPLGRKVGDLMWPEYYTQDMVEGFKRDSRVWNALYQQRPAPEDGDFFKKEWLIGYTPKDLPKNLRYYMASDHAVSSKQTADKTCLLPVGVCENGYIWVLPEMEWGRFSTDETVDKAIALLSKIKPLTWWAEKGHISQSIGPFLRKRMRERGIYSYIEEVTPTKNKRQRAQAIQGRMAMGMVRFPKFAPWWADAEYELLAFRGEGDRHDDWVDALAHLGMGLEKITPASMKRIVSKEDRPRPFTGEWLNASEERKKRRERMEAAVAGW